LIIPILRAFRLSQKRKTRGTRKIGERRRKRGEKITKMGRTG